MSYYSNLLLRSSICHMLPSSLMSTTGSVYLLFKLFSSIEKHPLNPFLSSIRNKIMPRNFVKSPVTGNIRKNNIRTKNLEASVYSQVIRENFSLVTLQFSLTSRISMNVCSLKVQILSCYRYLCKIIYEIKLRNQLRSPISFEHAVIKQFQA